MRIVSPSNLSLINFFQILLVYSLYMETVGEMYSIDLNYYPLALWALSLFSLMIGDFLCVVWNKNRVALDKSDRIFYDRIISLSSYKLNILGFLSFSSLFITSALIYNHSGSLPIFEIIRQKRDITEFNEGQAFALPGLYGAHAFGIILLEYWLGLTMLRAYIANSRLGPLFLLGCCIAVVVVNIDGKRQGMAMLVCYFMSSIFLIRQVVPRSWREIRRIFGMSLPFLSVFLIFIVCAMVYITYQRMSLDESVDNFIFEPLRYLAMPLINLEWLAADAGLTGFNLELLKPFYFLFPAKSDLIDRTNLGISVLEPTAPLGLFTIFYLFGGGVFGIAIYSLLVGWFSRYVLIRSRESPFYLLFYGYIVWSLIMAHSYNHFLTITFIPLQAATGLILAFIFSERSFLNNAKK